MKIMGLVSLFFFYIAWNVGADPMAYAPTSEGILSGFTLIDCQYITITLPPVPDPLKFLLFTLGVMTLLWIRKRLKKLGFRKFTDYLPD